MTEEQQNQLAFLQAVACLCEDHGYSLGHEDTHGAFVVLPYSVDLQLWLMAAHMDGEED